MPVTVDLAQAQANAKGYDSKSLDRVVASIIKAKKILCLTGAGISTAAGIPDFRSKHGLYELAAARCAPTASSPSSCRKSCSSSSSASSSSSSPHSRDAAKLSGQDMFSASVWQSPATMQRFLRFISTLHNLSLAAQPTATHTFLNVLKNKKKLLRCYTQNIDGLEERAGLQPVKEVSSPPSSRYAKGKGRANRLEGDVVHLHGRAGSVRCTVCQVVQAWTEEVDEAFSSGESLSCEECQGRWEKRRDTGRRTSIAVGALRPDITLYGEAGREDFMISDLQDKDVKAKPDCLIVMGTSLKVHGFKNLVRDFAGEVEEQGGTVIYVNLSAPNKEWDSHFDYFVNGSTDDFVAHVLRIWKKCRPQDWQTQALLTSSSLATITKGVSASAAAAAAAKPKEIAYLPPKVFEPLGKKDVNLVASVAFKSATNRPKTAQVASSAGKTRMESNQKEVTSEIDSDDTLVASRSPSRHSSTRKSQTYGSRKRTRACSDTSSSESDSDSDTVTVASSPRPRRTSARPSKKRSGTPDENLREALFEPLSKRTRSAKAPLSSGHALASERKAVPATRDLPRREAAKSTRTTFEAVRAAKAEKEKQATEEEVARLEEEKEKEARSKSRKGINDFIAKRREAEAVLVRANLAKLRELKEAACKQQASPRKTRSSREIVSQFI